MSHMIERGLIMTIRNLNAKEKAILKEVSTCNNLTYLKKRYDLLERAMNYAIKFGDFRKLKPYSMLSCYTFKEIKFYMELVKQRIELLESYSKLEEKRYKELNLI